MRSPDFTPPLDLQLVLELLGDRAAGGNGEEVARRSNSGREVEGAGTEGVGGPSVESNMAEEVGGAGSDDEEVDGAGAESRITAAEGVRRRGSGGREVCGASAASNPVLIVWGATLAKILGNAASLRCVSSIGCTRERFSRKCLEYSATVPERRVEISSPKGLARVGGPK